jgi:predicted N-acetyltransferase YhbS
MSQGDVVQLTAAEWEEGLAFLNEVFGEHRPHDFASLLPSIYQPTDEFMACNHAVREKGVIRAIVGLFPIDWQVGETTLRVGGIGGVSTHGSVRGKGYMKQLMTHCVQRMQDEGMHLSWLGGQRQRYGYFGYEKCGQALSVSLTPANVRHTFGDVAPLAFEPLTADDSGRIDTARRLHDAQLVHCRRGGSDVFPRFLASWYHKPHAALENGRMVGYLVADEEGGNVVELLARDPETALAMARSWVQSRQSGARFDIPPTRYALARRLGALGEGLSVSTSGNWQIYDWAAVVGALLRVRLVGGQLADGEVAIGIEGYGALRICVDGDQVECERTDIPPAVTWSPSVAMRVFFGPHPAFAVAALPAAAAPLLAWCPLPLGWPRQDGV